LANWYFTLELFCQNPLSYVSIASFYCFGYACGVIFFFLPDQLGRKKTLMLSLGMNIIAMYLAIYDQRIPVKKFGFFLNGFFHIRYSGSIIHSLEMVPDVYKNANFTGLLLFEVSVVFYACLVFYFYSPSIQLVFDIHFILGVGMYLAYCLVVPESPRWLFQRDGPKSKDAINVLNYIAWFNGSSKRIPLDAHFDIIGQVVNESIILN
jgi:hypothetical protein